MPVEDRDRVVGFHARRNLAAPVDAEGLEQDLRQRRVARQHLVVERDGADDGAEPAAPRLLQAHEADDVAGVRVVILPPRRLVCPHVRIVDPVAEIADVAEHVALRVLRYGAPEIRADAPEDPRNVRGGIPRTRYAADQHEAAAAQKLAPEGFERRPQGWQRELGLGRLKNLDVPPLDARERRLDLRDFARTQLVDPGIARRHLAAAPCRGAPDRAGRHRRGCVLCCGSGSAHEGQITPSRLSASSSAPGMPSQSP